MIQWILDAAWQENGHEYQVYALRTDEVCIHNSLAAVWLFDGKATDAQISKSKWGYGYTTLFTVKGMQIDEAKGYLETLLRMEGKL